MFNTINYLFHEKDRTELDVELLENFNPFITTKAFSYYESGAYCNFINDTLNVYSGIFENKEETFKFYDNIIPKLKRRKSEYIKKSKPDKVIQIPQQTLEFLSKRELDIYTNYDK